MNRKFVCKPADAMKDPGNGIKEYTGHGVYKCNPLGEYEITTKNLLLAEPHEDSQLSKITEIDPKVILGENTRCFEEKDTALNTISCFTNDGIRLYYKTEQTTLKGGSEITVTKLDRKAQESDFQTLEGKSF